MFTQYRISPAAQPQKGEMKPLIEKMLSCEFRSLSSDNNKWGFLYHTENFFEGWSSLSNEQVESLTSFLTQRGLQCQRKPDNHGGYLDEYIIFPEKNTQNEIIDALEKIFEPTNNPTIARNLK